VIARHWHGIARREFAEAYVRHLREETFPALALIPGFAGSSVLQRSVAHGVEFLVVTHWQSLAAIQAFAGNNPESAVVPQVVQRMMVSYDRTVSHYEVVQ
jgi:heme-degrading monooxygenase HmoA